MNFIPENYELVLYLDNEEANEKYYEEGTIKEITVYLRNKINNSLLDVSDNCEILFFDNKSITDGITDDIIITLDGDEVADLDNNLIIKPKKGILFNFEGSGKIKIFYFVIDNSGKKHKFFLEKEFFTYSNFFRNNYLKYLLTDYESKIIEKNIKFKVILNTLMTYMDIIFSLKNDIENITDPINTKEKFLINLGQEMGFERIDFEESHDSQFEKISSLIYREILKNLFDLMSIHGTKKSFELFFSLLGYDIEIFEFWWDENREYLIKINPEDDGRANSIEKESTFEVFTKEGINLNRKALDPRKFNSPQNNYNKAQKSNIIQIILKKNRDFGYLNLENNKKLLKKFLNFLKPLHVQFFPEIIELDRELLIETLPKIFDSFEGAVPVITFGGNTQGPGGGQGSQGGGIFIPYLPGSSNDPNSPNYDSSTPNPNLDEGEFGTGTGAGSNPANEVISPEQFQNNYLPNNNSSLWQDILGVLTPSNFLRFILQDTDLNNQLLFSVTPEMKYSDFLGNLKNWDSGWNFDNPDFGEGNINYDIPVDFIREKFKLEKRILNQNQNIIVLEI